MRRFFFLLAVILFFAVNTSYAQMTVKDSDNNTLIEVNDEGNMGSITLTDTSDALASQENKLYSRNDSLIWNGHVLCKYWRMH